MASEIRTVEALVTGPADLQELAEVLDRLAEGSVKGVHAQHGPYAALVWVGQSLAYEHAARMARDLAKEVGDGC